MMEELFYRLKKYVVLLGIVPLVAAVIAAKLLPQQQTIEHRYAFSIYPKFIYFLSHTHNCKELADFSCVLGLKKEDLGKQTSVIIRPDQEFSLVSTDKAELERIRIILEATVKSYLNFDSCNKNPVTFLAKALLKDLEYDFLNNKPMLFNYMELAKNPDFTKEEFNQICMNTTQRIMGSTVSIITSEPNKTDVIRLQRIIQIYFAVLLIGIVIVFVIPNIRQKLKST